MSGAEHPAPETCLYCDGTDPNCGFCEMGKPLDTQADWDASWGRTFDLIDQHRTAVTGRVTLRDRPLPFCGDLGPAGTAESEDDKGER